MKAIANGSLDSYLHAYARGAAAYGSPVWLRLFHEMNGNWYPWGGSVGSNSAVKLVAAWKHVHDIFVAEGATNVKFVWCPNIESLDSNGSLSNPANAIGAYYPGDGYVDFIALDGYNFGDGDGMVWRSFTTLYSSAYAQVTALSPDKPIFLAEVACAPNGGNKPAWILDMFSVIPQRFPRIAGVGWFNTNATEDSVSRDWRIDATTADLLAFRSAVSQGSWCDRPTRLLAEPTAGQRAQRGDDREPQSQLEHGEALEAVHPVRRALADPRARRDSDRDAQARQLEVGRHLGAADLGKRKLVPALQAREARHL